MRILVLQTTPFNLAINDWPPNSLKRLQRKGLTDREPRSIPPSNPSRKNDWGRGSQNPENLCNADQNGDNRGSPSERRCFDWDEAQGKLPTQKALDGFFLNLLNNETDRVSLSSKFHYQLLRQMTEYYDLVIEHSDHDPELVIDVCESTRKKEFC